MFALQKKSCVSLTLYKNIIYRSCINLHTVSTHQSVCIYADMKKRMRRCLPRFTLELRNSMQFTSKRARRCHRLFFGFKRKDTTLSLPVVSFRGRRSPPCVERIFTVEPGLVYLPLWTLRQETERETHYNPHQLALDQKNVQDVSCLVQSCQEDVRSPFRKLPLKSYL